MLFTSIFMLKRPVFLAYFLVVAMFVTRPTVGLAGANLRLELLAGGLCAIALTMDALKPGKTMSRIAFASQISIAFCIFWFCVSTLGTLANAPDLAKSFSVITWCLLNVISAVWVAKNPQHWVPLLRFGSVMSLISLFLAISAWLAATAGVAFIGVQVDPAYGGYAAFVFSLEANILGGLICLWGLVAAYNPLRAIGLRTRVILVSMTPLAILATHTRAALVAYVVGLVLVLLFRPGARKIIFTALVVGFFSVAFILAQSSDSGLEKFSSLLDTSSGTGGLRYRVNSFALSEWWQSPGRLIGLGWNSFGQRHYDDTQPGLRIPSYIGNLPLQILYDGGLISGLLVLVAASIVVVRFARNRKLGIVLCLAIPFIIISISTSALWFLETWLFVGLAWGYQREISRKDREIYLQRDVDFSNRDSTWAR